MLQPLRSRVEKDGMVSTTCPSCGAVQQLASYVFETRNHSARVKCPCGTTFTVLADFRKAYRREVNLSGAYTKRSSGQENKARIHNLSMTGAGLAVEGNHGLAPGDELMLGLVFDKGECPALEIIAEVVYLFDGYAGCRFKGMSADQEEALASYLVLVP